jgi:hypothetical protein
MTTERDDHDMILTMLAEGHSIGKTARTLDIDEADVKAALRQTVDNFRNGEHLQAEMALEDWRLATLGSKFFKAAMTSEGQNAYHMAVAYCRISGRRSELTGGNAPASYAITLMQKAAPPEMTSTKRIQAALDAVCHVSPREIELRKKDEAARFLDGPALTDDELHEYADLRETRERDRAARPA